MQDMETKEIYEEEIELEHDYQNTQEGNFFAMYQSITYFLIHIPNLLLS